MATVVPLSEQKTNIIMVDKSSKKPMLVGIRFKVTQLSNISTFDQTYDVHAFCQLDWIASDTDYQSFCDDRKHHQAEKAMNIVFKNAVDVEILEEDFNVQYGVKPGGDENVRYNIQVIRFKGIFSNEFYLENYPFDIQQLRFVVALHQGDQCINYVALVPSQTHIDTFMTDITYLSNTNWHISFQNVYIDEVDCYYAKCGKKDPTGEGTWSHATFIMDIKRKSFTSLVHVMLFLFTFGILSLLSVGIEPLNISDRLSYSIGLIFAVVAFQFVLSSEIPKIPYLTLIDKYNIYIFVFIISVCIENVIIGFQEMSLFEDNYKELDKYFYVIAAVVYFMFHLYFTIRTINAYKYEKSKIGQSPKVLETLLLKHGHKQRPIEYKTVLTAELSKYMRK